MSDPSPVLRPPSRGHTRYALLVLLFSLVCFSGALGAPGIAPEGKKQEKPYALIFGTVWGPDNRPLYAVKVKIRRAQDKKARWELYSDHRGEFAQRVPASPADYVVWADVKGYKLPTGKHLQGGPEVTVHIENDERADIGLHLK